MAEAVVLIDHTIGALLVRFTMLSIQCWSAGKVFLNSAQVRKNLPVAPGRILPRQGWMMVLQTSSKSCSTPRHQLQCWYQK
jgi:hypothetical protein